MDRMKPYVVKVSIFERVPYFVIAALILLWPGSPKWFAYMVLLLSISVASGSGGLATPAWKTMLAKVIHPDRKALLFALGMGIGGFLGIGGAEISRLILRTNPYPLSYGYCFALAFAGQAISWMFLTLNREPAKKMESSHANFSEYMRHLPKFVRSDPNFGKYLVSQIFIIMGSMGVAFYIIYGRVKFGITDDFAARLTTIALISQSISVPFIGWLSDRIGHKLITQGSILISVASIIVVLVMPNLWWLGAVFVLMNISQAGIRVARMSITMEFGNIERLPTYTAISGLVFGVVTIAASIIGGASIDLFGYSATFYAALVFTIVGLLIMSFGVRDPRRGRVHV